MIIKWVAKLSCEHTTGGAWTEPPQPLQTIRCPKCEALHVVLDVVTDVPLRPPTKKKTRAKAMAQ